MKKFTPWMHRREGMTLVYGISGPYPHAVLVPRDRQVIDGKLLSEQRNLSRLDPWKLAELTGENAAEISALLLAMQSAWQRLVEIVEHATQVMNENERKAEP